MNMTLNIKNRCKIRGGVKTTVDEYEEYMSQK